MAFHDIAFRTNVQIASSVICITSSAGLAMRDLLLICCPLLKTSFALVNLAVLPLLLVGSDVLGRASSPEPAEPSPFKPEPGRALMRACNGLGLGFRYWKPEPGA